MLLTEVEIKVDRIHKLEGDGKTRAFADIIIGDVVLIKGFRVVSAKEGIFVSAPGKRGKDGKWYNNVRLLTQEMKEKLTEVVLSAYDANES